MRALRENFTQRTHRTQRSVCAHFAMRALRLAGNGLLTSSTLLPCAADTAARCSRTEAGAVSCIAVERAGRSASRRRRSSSSTRPWCRAHARDPPTSSRPRCRPNSANPTLNKLHDLNWKCQHSRRQTSANVYHNVTEWHWQTGDQIKSRTLCDTDQ